MSHNCREAFPEGASLGSYPGDLRMLTHEWSLQPGGYCSEPPPEVSGSAHGPMREKPSHPPQEQGGAPRASEEGARGQVKSCPSLTFTVSLGILLLEASLRGQSSSGNRVDKGFHLASSPSLPEPSTVYRRAQHPSPCSISVPTWGCEFFYLGLFALKDR